MVPIPDPEARKTIEKTINEEKMERPQEWPEPPGESLVSGLDHRCDCEPPTTCNDCDQSTCPEQTIKSAIEVDDNLYDDEATIVCSDCGKTDCAVEGGCIDAPGEACEPEGGCDGCSGCEDSRLSAVQVAREIMKIELEHSEGLQLGYVSNIAMLLHDNYGVTDYVQRNEAARDILKLMFNVDIELDAILKWKEPEN